MLSLSMFYILMFCGLSVRIYVTIFINVTESYAVILNFLLPISIKISIGLVQLSIIIEITVRVRESINTFKLINRKKKLNAQNMINQVLANEKKSDRYVLILQICVLIFCISLITYITTLSIIHDKYNGNSE